MYDFVDRPVARASYGGRFLLWSMRAWIGAAMRGTCPPGALAPAFARHAALPALPHLHQLLASLNADARHEISFAPLGHCRIVEDEAVLLQLWRDATEAPPRARATLGLLLEAESVGAAFAALLSAVARLADAGLDEVAMDTSDVTG